MVILFKLILQIFCIIDHIVMFDILSRIYKYFICGTAARIMLLSTFNTG